eukprot:6214377-Pleurochrysis_carterae.AAC.2
MRNALSAPYFAQPFKSRLAQSIVATCTELSGFAVPSALFAARAALPSAAAAACAAPVINFSLARSHDADATVRSCVRARSARASETWLRSPT